MVKFFDSRAMVFRCLWEFSKCKEIETNTNLLCVCMVGGKKSWPADLEPLLPGAPTDAYAGFGASGQVLVVLPSLVNEKKNSK